ncbi:MAG TPA: site-specific DNA-methyltransferase [Candidatus Paceibacterota bacterium]|nr:site-specific DNA-methyltransferase [Candidatus Pacearchaeota archaeon]HRZ51326.1 site-specific DNA-methyltransferase [Candidatus Paceibacterota bacterium]HSA37048.1 site-specific DNA-methyltransferase [Candidatus Paceibacterota bacterium]
MAKEIQKIEQAKGRPLLQWVGKHPLESIEYYPAQEKEAYGDLASKEFNKLFWGDNLQVLAHLLKEYRGTVDLIYIDPPFDSKADYVKKVKLRGEQFEGQQQNVLEEKQYTDIWEQDEYLQFMYERLMLMKELLSDKGFIVVHLNVERSHYIKTVMDEVFGNFNFRNEIIVRRIRKSYVEEKGVSTLNEGVDYLLLYSSNPATRFKAPVKFSPKEERWHGFDAPNIRPNLTYELFGKLPPAGRCWMMSKGEAEKMIKDGSLRPNQKTGVPEYKLEATDFITRDTLWDDITAYAFTTGYPTEKKEDMLEILIQTFAGEGGVVADFFIGSGTTCAVAQKLGRRWIGCDINLGAIQTTTKRLNQVIEDQRKDKKGGKDFKGLLAFKVLNVNDYDVFKNELEAKEIIMEMYGVEPVKRTYFDGTLDKSFVKVMPLNRVLNRMDIRTLIKNINEKIDGFTAKAKSKSGEPVYEEGVLVICSGVELDVSDFIKKENKTGVKIDVRDIQTDKQNLIFKQKPEAKIKVKAAGGKLEVKVLDFHSPILMRKLEIENSKVVKKENRAKVGDFRQIIDSVAVDVDYNGKLFNAEIMDLPDKKEVIKADYSWDYKKKGDYTVAVKVVDVLGEEYFETFNVTA